MHSSLNSWKIILHLWLITEICSLWPPDLPLQSAINIKLAAVHLSDLILINNVPNSTTVYVQLLYLIGEYRIE